MFRRFLMIFQCVIALVKAWMIKLTENMNNVSLSAENRNKDISPTDVAYLGRITRWIMKLKIIGKKRKCFFYSYILASVLRKWGTPAILNVGLSICGPSTRTEGHCWVTTEDGALIEEPSNPERDYPVFIGPGTNGILYWINLQNNPN